jgi:hypothetical protein
VLTVEEREMVFSAIIRASRSAQRRQAATVAAAAAVPISVEAGASNGSVA